ncbi:MAG: SGNH/GDSL hydrolase family protein [Kiritimatiellia bacterium]
MIERPPSSSGGHASRLNRRLPGKLLLSITTLWFGLELVLRLAPHAIPTKALVYFREDLRARIAAGRFATREGTVRLERDDGGPELRIWKPFYVKPYELSDPGTLKSVPTDEIGFSNPPETYTRHDSFDVVAIGDSFTWAFAVEPTAAWSLQLGALTGLSVLNLGKGGTGLYEYLQILKKFGLAKHPRIVVMNVYEGNDVRDAVAYQAYRSGGPGSDEAPPSAWKRVPLLSRSYVVNLIGGTAEYLAARHREKAAEGAVDFRFRVDPENADILFNAQQAARDEVVFPRRIVAGELAFTVFDEAIRAFAELARTHGFIPVMMYSPAACTAYHPVRFNDPALADVLPRFSQMQRAYLSKQAVENGIQFLDLTDALQAAAFPESGCDPTNLLYFPTSIHYSPRGHAVAARALADFLTDLEADPEK